MSGTITESNRADIPVGTPFFTAVADIGLDGTGDMTGPAYHFQGAPSCDGATLFPPEFVIRARSDPANALATVWAHPAVLSITQKSATLWG